MHKLISPWMTDELALLADQAGRFLSRELVPQADRWERAGRVDREAWRSAGDAGLLCASIPTEYGGGGGTLAHEIVVLQAIELAGLSGFGAGVSISSSIVAHYILSYGTHEQKQRWLPHIASGAMIGAIAMTEPSTGSDLQNLQTVAQTVTGGYRLSGQKTFITNGINANLIIVAAKMQSRGREQPMSLLVVESEKAEGFTRGQPLEKIGMHSQDTAELFFNEVFVSEENLLGQTEGQGFAQLKKQLAWERLVCAHAALVGIERAVELTVEYTNDRMAFGQRISSFQNTQFKLAECQTTAVVARTFFDSLLVRLLDGDLDPVTAAMAKWWITDAQSTVADECLQLHGGYGYMADYPIARIWTDARVMRIYAGTNEIMKSIIARGLANRP